jgi:hypothetical protein
MIIMVGKVLFIIDKRRVVRPPGVVLLVGGHRGLLKT